MSNGISFIGFDEVHALAPWPDLIEALYQAHLGPRPMGNRAMLSNSHADGQSDIFIAVPAWQPGKALGAKLVTSFPRNVQDHGVPTVDALYVLFDPTTGKKRAVIDGEALVFRKTCADSALGVRLLSSPDVRRFLMVGAGALAPYMIKAILAVRPGIEELRIWNRTAERADRLSQRFAVASLDCRVSEDLNRDLGWADIVISATMATEPLILGGQLKAGAHVGLVGSFTPAMREGDDALLGRADIFIDDPGTLDRSGEFVGPLAEGVITRADVLGDLFDLCQARVRPFGGDKITLFKNGGAAHLDLFVAQFVAQRAGLM